MKKMGFISIICLLVLGSCRSSETERVAEAAREFRSQYFRDYISVADISKNVYSADTCIQRIHTTGLWASFDFNQNQRKCFLNPNRAGRFLPLEVDATDLSIPETGQTLTPLSIYTGLDYPALLAGYRDDLDRFILLHKRAVEIYGPLNPRMVDLFSYRQVGVDDGVTAISFSGKKGFPKKTRIRGNGILYLDAEGHLVAFRMENLEDRYSSHIYDKCPGSMPRVTEDVLEVEYARADGKIWTRRVLQEIHWTEPENKKWNKYYSAETAPYRNPFKNRISTWQEMCFTDPVGGNDVAQVKKAGLFPEDSRGPDLGYVLEGDGPTRSFMEKILAERRRNLEQSGLSEMEVDEEMDRIENAQTKAMELYHQLYGKQYEKK